MTSCNFAGCGCLSLPYSDPRLLQVQQIIILVLPCFPTTDDNLFLLLLPIFGHGAQQILQLLLGDFGSQLTRLCQHDKPVFDFDGVRLFDQADAAKSVGSFGVEDLIEGGLAGFGCEWRSVRYIAGSSKANTGVRGRWSRAAWMLLEHRMARTSTIAYRLAVCRDKELHC